MYAQNPQHPPTGPRPARHWSIAPLLVPTLALALALLTGCADGAPAPSTPAQAEPTLSGGPSAPVAGGPTDTAVPSGLPPEPPTGPSPTGAASSALPPPTAAALPPPTTAAPPAGATLPDAEAVIVYSLVAHDLVAQSLTTAPAPAPPPYIGVNPRAGQGPLLDTDSSTAAIPTDLIDNMADLGTTVTFTPFVSAVGALDEGGQVRDGGIYLTLGVLEPASGGAQVGVYGSFYRASNDATGYRYTLARVSGGPWVIKDRQQEWDH